MPKWTSEQQLAIDKENSNIIVSASAGSGKTAVLTERVLRKLKSGTKIDELLILTFTKAAAKEMKERIKDGIIKEGLTDNLKLLNKSYITTFDSYALSIVKKYHYILNMSSNVSIEEGGILNLQIKKILNEIFDEEYEKEESSFIKFISDFCLKDDEELKTLLLNLYSKLDLKIDKDEYLNNYIETYYDENKINEDICKYIDVIKKKILEIENLLKILSNYAENMYLEKINEALSSLLNSNTYDEIKQNAKVSLPTIPRNSDEHVKEIKEIISKKISEIVELTNFESEDEILNLINGTKENANVIIKLIKELDKRFNDFKEKNELYNFNDIAKKAIQILKENESIRLELKNYFKEIMIDEYQDTSDIQEEFIKLIENNNVYMVGDIKQSIYRFRNANPYIFKNKYDNYKQNINGFKIDLSKNFRSRSEVIDDINVLFNDIMDDEIGGANYKKEHAMIFGNTTYNEIGNNHISNHLEIYNYEYDKDTIYSKEEIEIFAVANDIKQKVENNYPVMDKKTNQIRSITYNDFVILMDKSKYFNLYKKIFEYLNIPLTIKRDENLLSNKNISLLKNLCELIILNNKNDYSSNYNFDFLSIGRSYLFEYDDNTLFNMIKNKNYDSLLKDLIDEMGNYLNESIHVFLDILFDKLNIYEKIIKIGNIEENMMVLDYLKTISESLENMGYGIEEFTTYLSDLKEQGLDIKYSITDHFNDSVKIMTVHGSKGLEYPICYYTGLHSKFNIRELNEKILLSDNIVIPYINGYFRKTIYYYLLKNKYIQEEISEQIRLFYVALTRAREKMIVVSSIEEKNNLKENNIVLGRLNYKSFNDILCSIKDKLESYIVPLDIDKLNITRDYQYMKKNSTEVINDEKIEVKELLIPQAIIEDAHYSKEQSKILTKEEQELFNFGTKVHYALEVLDFKNPNYNIDLPELYINKIDKFLHSKLFDDNIIEIYKEYEFIYEEQMGIIDLILETNETLKVIDYKLKNINDEAYVNQLKGYQKYLSSISNKKIELYLYSILNEELLEIK